MRYIKENDNCIHKKKLVFYFAMIAVSLLSLYPICILIAYSLGISVHDINLSLDVYKNIIKKKEIYTAALNTIYMAAAITFFSGLIGTGLAFLVEKTNILFKKLIKYLVFITFIIPSYIMAISWIECIGANGYLTRRLSHFMNFNMYSLEGIVFVMTLHLYPIVFMSISNALRKLDFNLENAAFVSGASSWTVIRTIIIPHIKPALLSILFFVFSKSISCFGVAALLGLPAHKYVLTTYIYSSMSAVDFKSAAAISVILLFISLSLFIFSNKLLNKGKCLYSNASNKVHIYNLGKFRKVISVFILMFLLITSFVPIITIFISSFLKRWGIPLTINNLTMNNYSTILFNNDMFVRGIKNSFLYGIIASIVAGILGIIISYASKRTQVHGRKVIEFISLLPMAIPEVVIATAAVFAWINKPFKLYGTPWIIIVTYTAVCLPFYINNINGLISSYDPMIEKASEISGATFVQTIKNVVIPIIKPSLITGFILTMLLTLREIPVSIMLYSSGCETIGVLMFNLRSDIGGLETISALAVIIVILMFLGQFIIQKIGVVKRR